MIKRSWFRRHRQTVNCREVGKVLQSHLDGAVEPDFAGKIAEHLEDCKNCGLEYETYARIKESLGRQRPAVDPETVSRLRDFGQSLTGD